MLPGTWAYVSAGAFGRAIIVSCLALGASFILLNQILFFCCLIVFGLYVFQQDESEIGVAGGNGQLWTLGVGLLATAIAATYVTRLAKVFTILAFCLLPGVY